MVPGLLCDDALWEAQRTALEPNFKVQVARLDQGATITEIAGYVLAAAAPRFALAGLSLGGYVALEIMRQAPARVSRLALLDTSARPDDAEKRRRRRGLIELARKGRFKGVTPRLIPSLIGPAAQDDPAVVDTILAMAGRLGRDGFIRQQNAILSRPDSRPDLPTISCPTLVAVGAHDQLTPPDLSAEMAAAIPGARLYVFDQCGHLPPLERPAETVAVLEDWLGRP
ncbi:MAG: alpha/beta fold hydrolase [Pseudomonadota bacterium]|nr:alpha/beta fold hydrolase [Pseudomonadota bacterium]